MTAPRALLAATLAACTLLTQAAVLDDMKDASPWKASASDQVKAALRRDAQDGSLCLDYDFSGVSGYAVMRRELPLDWPQDFALSVQLKGQGRGNDVQLKLVDASGDNVWWVNRPALALPETLTESRFKRRHVAFAWGPATDRTLRHSQFVELVVVAGQQGGGAGRLCLGALAMEPREPAPASWPEPRRTLAGGEMTLDFQRLREFNGLWFANGAATRIEASDDNRRWKLLSARPGRAVFLGEQEWRWLRLRYAGRKPPEVQLRDAARWPDLNAAVAELAKSLPRGDLPRAFVGEQNYWTVVGVDGGAQRSGLVSEDGAIELSRGGPSVEPAVLLADGRMLTWAQARIEHSLVEQALPVVQWRHAEAELHIEAAADGPASDPQLLARYTLRNPTGRPQRYGLLLTLRPWQVNPPQQFLSTQGGVSPLPALGWADGRLTAAGLGIVPRETPAEVRAAPFGAGAGLATLLQAPPLQALADPEALPSALMRFDVELAPGESRGIGWVSGRGSLQARDLDTRLAVAAAGWRDRLGALSLRLPPEAAPVADTMRSALAQILMSREGPALRPGTRSYARSWVRDGAMMVAGLLRMGETRAATEFVDWFGGHIFESGKVPCCVDQRGSDPVVENDSHGEYLFAVAELWRHTQDRALLQRHWPQVQRVVAWMEGLRQSERKPGADPRFWGLMPPSISHEGYSDKPAYSYWDDFWALRGYKDAVQMAEALGDAATARRWAVWRDEFEADLAGSVVATARHYGIDHVAGAADRGDFDATSTTMALNPAQADKLPPALLRATFERYWAQALARIEGRKAWKDYTPYELRNVSALVRLGRVDEAHRLLAWFFGHQRPAGWNQWAEVVLPDAREPRFLGDMPHAWISSDYLRSALDLFAYEREAGGSLVLGAGLPLRWKLAGDIGVAGLSTAWGRLDYRLERRAAGGWTLSIDRRPERLAGELRLAWPGDEALPRASAEGRELAWQGRELPLPPGVAAVQLEPRR
ncbi:hypothetical protein LXT12_11045 [Pelomonas sp. P7]|uniref:Coagulation factor 5/8 type domain-containing protein n=1 Tax=Pelomonas caseinilytica TaxID=2906763 RepID=A0ABS8XDH9_9BURK|nr:hypothetical protein [Pelomonas sp. P7]MCE4537785.1 hypothetical protein [Pelomonas sp. P7]